MENRVRIEAVERLHFPRCHNTVAWERSLKGDKPEIDQACRNRVPHGPTPGVGASKDPRPTKSEAEVRAEVSAALRRAFADTSGSVRG